jgi:flagellar hook-basal body complex protein FliE
MAAPLSAAGAAAAYRTSASLTPSGTVSAGPSEGSALGSFGSFLEKAVSGTIEAGRQGDIASAQGLAGQANVTDVVVAVSRAELALQTAVTVRDRVIAAYQEVLRMPI